MTDSNIRSALEAARQFIDDERAAFDRDKALAVLAQIDAALASLDAPQGEAKQHINDLKYLVGKYVDPACVEPDLERVVLDCAFEIDANFRGAVASVKPAPQPDALREAVEELNAAVDAFWNDPERPSIAKMRNGSVHRVSLAQDKCRAARARIKALVAERDEAKEKIKWYADYANNKDKTICEEIQRCNDAEAERDALKVELAATRADEREKCARIAEAHWDEGYGDDGSRCAEDIAAAIRRG